ncbi:hypothetical protein MBBAR_10c00320 [Methanobrevibacter arboriphilus JCM 13429 = DSM 1125]|uniref:DUF2634 domain-containing protein n=1 Tax=Methanobrevibacter arboriphilus JCM 13429 = DSM 1125 TaxID=1300164 RepID=A0A1V6N1Y4_METAZ|nr:hypothetical protein [Methanobrevibacter arboriphilus]OQD58691.1 hypothetical protein MBBAR_10c00320 [Methanobrevibacter arboriphilus JCM 13429 = DSM 1125]
MVDVDYGCDIDSSLEVDPLTGDFKIVEGLDNAAQAVKNRLETKLDELLILGYENYGNQSFEEQGNTDIDTAIGHIEIYTRDASLEEPLVKDLININISFENNSIHGELLIKLTNGEIIPTSFDINEEE